MSRVEQFVRDGFVPLRQAVPREVGDQAREIVWRWIGLDPDDPATWTKPVVWATDHTGEGPFRRILASAALAEAMDELAGPGGWAPRFTLGNMPVRFPHSDPSNDDGWHIDANSVDPGDGTWGLSRRPSTMLLLALLSDVGPDDAPTRIRVGSHHDVPGILDRMAADVGVTAMDGRLDFFAAGPRLDEGTAHRPVAYATGEPGDLFLCHPFLVHAAQRHQGTRPRFMSQMPMFLAAPLTPQGPASLAAVFAS
ncbi:phytanoyl-CoA dioxygenase family protein [Streptosporangiaceae bacterium NEAU-GS5]|nr:phytanoyl-CoA dioxygenase family protein [Streptosporangiaceae bacterium NEAU-GS5]